MAVSVPTIPTGWGKQRASIAMDSGGASDNSSRSDDRQGRLSH